MDDRSDFQRQQVENERHKRINRLAVTRELTKNQYNRLCQFEQKHGEQSPEQIAKMFNLLRH